VAQGTLNSDRFEGSSRIEETGNANHGIQLQERNRYCWIVEIYQSMPELLEQIAR